MSVAGDTGRDSAGMSSENSGEKPGRRKSKDSCTMLIRAGLVGP